MSRKTKKTFQSLKKLGGPPPGTVAALAIGQNQGQTLFAGTRVGLFRSERQPGQAFQDWQRFPAAPLGIVSLAVSPGYAEDHILAVGTNTGLFISQDAGENWRAAETPTTSLIAVSIAFSPNFAADGSLLAGTLEDGIIYSADRGRTWHKPSIGLLDGGVFALALSPAFAQDATAFAGADTAVYASSNPALAWEKLPFPAGAAPALSIAVSPAFEDDHTLYVGTEKEGLYRSMDRGVTWQKLPIPAACINALVILPDGPAVAAATEAGVWVSLDRGQTWKRVFEQSGVFSLAAQPGLVCAGVADEGVWWTDDLAEWRTSARLHMRPLVGLVLSPQFERDHIAYSFGPQEPVWKTRDGGLGWEALDGDLPGLNVNALVLAPDHTLVAASPAGVCLSTAGGSQWRQIAAQPAERLSLSPNGKLLAAGFSSAGIRLTQDFGNTWQTAAGPWDAGGQVVALSLDDANRLYVAWLDAGTVTIARTRGLSGQIENVLSGPAGEDPVISFVVAGVSGAGETWTVSLGNRIWQFGPSQSGRPLFKSTVFPSNDQGERIVSLTAVAGPAWLALTGQHLFKSTDAKSWALAYDFGGERAIALAVPSAYVSAQTVYALLLGGAVCRVVIR